MNIQSAMPSQRKIVRLAAIAIAIGALAACSGGSSPSVDAAAAVAGTDGQSSATQATAEIQPAASVDFPSGTTLGDLGLPVYPTPKEHISPNENHANEAGEKSVSVLMEPHDPFNTVVAWYKAHMPTDSYTESGNPKHAQFQIGKDGDKVIRMVVIDNINEGQTHLILIKKTYP